jgi:signal peptidase I
MTPDAPATTSITETLANLNILWILAIIAGLSLLRLAFVYVKSDSARSFAEILESGIIAVAFVFLLIRPFLLQAFFIPSPSMEPTLLGKNNVGDRILVNKFEYRFSKPSHDNVVVFLAPPAAMEGDPEFIKRLIGMPGDTIQVSGGVVSVNGRPYNHAGIRQALGAAGEFGPEAQAAGFVDQADHHAKFVADGVMADTHLVTKERLATILTGMPHATVQVEPGYVTRNGQKLDEPFIAEDPDYDLKMSGGEPLKHEHGMDQDTTYQDVYLLAGQPITTADFQAKWAKATEPIPAAHYLMMGDNRNDSNDGTNWGPLEARRVVGRAQIIFWPPSRMGIIH